MGNRVDEMMDNWGSENDPEKLFSDQIEEDSAFLFEEPGIGIEELTLDEPQSGITHVPNDIKKVKTINSELKDEGQPGIFQIESSQLESLANQQKEIDIDSQLSKMFGYIADYGLVHGMGLYYADNYDIIEEESYGEEEGI